MSLGHEFRRLPETSEGLLDGPWLSGLLSVRFPRSFLLWNWSEIDWDVCSRPQVSLAAATRSRCFPSDALAVQFTCCFGKTT